MKKLAIITTHPIQYYAPVFKLLHDRGRAEIKVYYTWGEQSHIKFDPGFEKSVKWDLPLLEGYSYEWVHNTSANPGSDHFSGIKNPHLIRQITEWKPDAILVFGWAYHSHLKVLLHFHGKLPIYFRGDSTLLDEGSGFKNLLKKRFLNWIYSHIDHGFYVGNQNKKYYQEYGLKKSQLSFTPHSIDNCRFAEDRTHEVLKLRNKLGLGNADILILFAGKFEEKKDPALLLKAFLEIHNDNIHLLFVGNGVLEDELKILASLRLNMTDQWKLFKKTRIHFMDFQNQTQMPIVYQACDLFCLPSKGPGESWGLAVNEAMACGKAILASDRVGCSYDLVNEGKNGLIFESGNLSDLRAKLEDLISCKNRLKQFGKRSEEIIQSWNFDAIVLAIETILINAAKKIEF